MDKRSTLKEVIRENSGDIVTGIKMGKIAFEMDAELEALNGGELFLEVLQEEIGKMRRNPYPGGLLRIMISQPMSGKTDEEIARNRDWTAAKLERCGYHVVDSCFTEEWNSDASLDRRGVVKKPVYFLAKSLERMADCHAVYFCKGWEQAQGCRIEHAVADAYGLKRLYEVEPERENEGCCRNADAEPAEEPKRCVDYMAFGRAIEAARVGKRIARKGWNGKGQYVELATHISYIDPMGNVINANHEAISNEAFAFVGTSGVQLGWLASQADMLAADWYIVEEPVHEGA